MPAFDLSAMQWIASTALTLARVTIALVAALFAYRQNYGWKPAILVLSKGFGPDANGVHIAYVDFEVWNRRKYPIVIHGVEIKFGSLKLDHRWEKHEWTKSDWWIFHNKLCHRPNMRLDLASHHLFQPRIPFKQQKVEDETIKIDVYYFDPIANARKEVTTALRYKYTEEC
jgi:hypothetical protein